MRGLATAAPMHDPKCRGCARPESEVGALTLTVERTRHGATSAQLCGACRASSEGSQAENIAGLSLVAFVNAEREAHRCTSCGRSRIVVNLNIGRRGARTKLEPVSAATHCDCPPDGPAYTGLRSLLSGRAS